LWIYRYFFAAFGEVNDEILHSLRSFRMTPVWWLSLSKPPTDEESIGEKTACCWVQMNDASRLRPQLGTNPPLLRGDFLNFRFNRFCQKPKNLQFFNKLFYLR